MLRRSPAALFSCTGISLDLGGREILRDINLHVDVGEVLGIIGPNGAGKTSLFEVLSGRMLPKSGTVIFKDKNVTSLPLYERARLGIGRTYQTPVVPDELTVGETFKAARQAYRPYCTKFDAEYGAELVGLNVDDDEPAVRLDTLNRRKLLLACLLMRRPTLLLMDEPAAGLINSEVDEIDFLAAHAVEGNEHRNCYRRASHRAPRNDRRSRDGHGRWRGYLRRSYERHSCRSEGTRRIF